MALVMASHVLGIRRSAFCKTEYDHVSRAWLRVIGVNDMCSVHQREFYIRVQSASRSRVMFCRPRRTFNCLRTIFHLRKKHSTRVSIDTTKCCA